MKIVHVLGQVGRVVHNPEQHALAGIGNAALQIAAAQAALGHDVAVCGFSDPLPTGFGTWQGVEISTVRRWGWARISPQLDASLLLPSFARLTRQRPIDVLHIHELGLLHLPLGRIRILHIHIPLGVSAASSKLWRKSDGIVCVSEYVRQSLVRMIGYPEERIYTAYNGAPPVDFGDSEVQKARETLGIARNQVMILYVGALVPQKGPDVLLKAFREMVAAHSDTRTRAKLVIVGGSALWRMKSADADVYEQELRSLADGLDVSFLGMLPHNEVLRLFQASDIAVAPSIFPEPFGMVVCEAMAAGTPVIASRVGGIPEVVLEGKCGILVSRGDHCQLAEALYRLVEDPILRSRMGAAAKKRAQLFTWAAAAERMQEIYEGLLR